jgi:hypothetical protein
MTLVPLGYHTAHCDSKVSNNELFPSLGNAMLKTEAVSYPPNFVGTLKTPEHHKSKELISNLHGFEILKQPLRNKNLQRNCICWDCWNKRISEFFIGTVSQRGLWPLHLWGLYIRQNDAPQSVWLVWTNDQLDVQTSPWQHNNHKRQTSMPLVLFETKISAGERPQTYALNRAVTETYNWVILLITETDCENIGWITCQMNGSKSQQNHSLG